MPCLVWGETYYTIDYNTEFVWERKEGLRLFLGQFLPYISLSPFFSIHQNTLTALQPNPNTKIRVTSRGEIRGMDLNAGESVTLTERCGIQVWTDNVMVIRLIYLHQDNPLNVLAHGGDYVDTTHNFIPPVSPFVQQAGGECASKTDKVVNPYLVVSGVDPRDLPECISCIYN